MPWRTPKTDWDRFDFFNIDPDYIRITDNIREIAAVARPYFGTIYLEPMQQYPQIELDYPFEYVLNVVENNLTTLGERILNLITYPAHVTQYTNQEAWDYIDLNRIESFSLTLYENAVSTAGGGWGLPYMLGGDLIASFIS